MASNILTPAVAALLLALISADAASARRAPDTSADPLAVQAMRNFAICVVRRSPQGAVGLLAMDYRGVDHERALQRLAIGNNDCVPGGRLHFSGVLFSGGLAEAMLRPRLRRSALAPLVAWDSTRAPIVARDQIEGMALCAVRQAPAETQALLATEPGTDAEEDAARALTPALAFCLGQGEIMRLNRPGMRAVLALAAYRLVGQGLAPPAD